jgi:hypothetical protein
MGKVCALTLQCAWQLISAYSYIDYSHDLDFLSSYRIFLQERRANSQNRKYLCHLKAAAAFACIVLTVSEARYHAYGSEISYGITNHLSS